MLRSNRRYDIFIFITITILTLLLLVPFLWVFFSAFKSENEIFGSPFLFPKEWKLDNFVIAWTKGNFSAFFWNSAVTSISVMVITAVVACPAGYAFAKLKLRNYPVVFYIFLFGMTIPAQSVIIPLFYQLKSYGLLDTLLAFVITIVGLGIPFSIYLMRNFFRDIPDTLMEAGKIDGAGTWGVFWWIMLPLSKPGILAISVFSFLGAWNEFLIALLLLISGDKSTIPLGLMQFQQQHYSDYGAVFAGVVLAFIPSILIYAVLQKSFIRGIASGSMK